MVELKYVKSTKCPVCGCTTVANESIEVDHFNKIKREFRQHTNGGRWESRLFLCDYEVKYIPNFRTEIVIKNCSLDPDLIKEKKDEQELREQIKDVVEKSSAKESYKSKILSCLI